MTFRPKDDKERIQHRLKIALGHLKKVQEMVSNDEYCIDIINQSLAVQSALKETDTLLLKNHLEGCVVDDIKKGKADESINEIMKLFRKSK